MQFVFTQLFVSDDFSKLHIYIVLNFMVLALVAALGILTAYCSSLVIIQQIQDLNFKSIYLRLQKSFLLRYVILQRCFVACFWTVKIRGVDLLQSIKL